MSSISNLFSKAKKDESLLGVFNDKAAGPAKRTVKQRTVLKMKDPEPKDDDEEMADSDEESEENSEEEQEKPAKSKKKRNDDNEDLEDKYMEKLLTNDKPEEQEQEPEGDESGSDSDSDSEDESEQNHQAVPASEAKKLDLKESEIAKAERTVFIGNIAVSVITSKPNYKAFKKLFGEYGDVESIRFRSIAFSEQLPRKAAFVKQSIHPTCDSVNAYVVFKEKDAARKSLTSNGKVFLDLHMRVDSVSHPAVVDNKRSIFVGNLDFEERDEELWNIFGECGDIEFVRIVRDSKTNVGKGFGYVQFKDSIGVNKALMFHEKKLGEKKRKLRITRSKKMKPTQSSHKSNAVKNLSEDQKTKLGRAKRVLGKADRATAGNIIEGQRAKKGDRVEGIKNGKGRVKKPRKTRRSTDFKKAREASK
jgi:nucleolar protein 12